jgi:hypothetical protein
MFVKLISITTTTFSIKIYIKYYILTHKVMSKTLSRASVDKYYSMRIYMG